MDNQRDGKGEWSVFEKLGLELGSLVTEKDRAYGNSFEKSGAVMRIMYPKGISSEQMDDALAVTRILDKLFRIANRKDAFGESPYRDIAGYGLLGAVRHDNERSKVKTILEDFGVEDVPCSANEISGFPSEDVEMCGLAAKMSFPPEWGEGTLSRAEVGSHPYLDTFMKIPEEEIKSELSSTGVDPDEIIEKAEEALEQVSSEKGASEEGLTTDDCSTDLPEINWSERRTSSFRKELERVKAPIAQMEKEISLHKERWNLAGSSATESAKAHDGDDEVITSYEKTLLREGVSPTPIIPMKVGEIIGGKGWA